MNNASPFYIYISNSPISSGPKKTGSSSGGGGGSGGNGGGDGGSNASSKSSKNKFGISRYTVTRVAESCLHTAERGITQSINAIGYMEGNYSKQNEYQQVQKYSSKVANTAITAGVAAITGHYLVAAIDVAVSVTNFAVDAFFTWQEHSAEVKKSNYVSEQMTKRAGLSSSYDGSRGTEN